MKENRLPIIRPEVLISVLLLLISGLFHFSSVSPGHSWGGDFAAYIHQGKSLANGSTEQLDIITSHRVGNSAGTIAVGPTAYPWGFPAALALVIIVFGESLFAMKLLVIGFFLGCQVVIHLLLRGRTAMIGIYAVVFAFALNSYVYTFKNQILPDVPFTFFVLLTLVLCRTFLIEKKDPSIVNLGFIGASMFLAFSMRANAIALLPAVAFLQVLGKVNDGNSFFVSRLLGGLKRIRLSDLTPYLIFAVGTVALNSVLADPILSYADTGHIQIVGIEQLFKRVASNAWYYLLLPMSRLGTPVAVYALIVIPVLLVGVARSGTENMDLLIYIFFHMLILLVFPGRQGLRYVLPLLPMLLFFLFVGGRDVVNWFIRLGSKDFSIKRLDIALVAILIVGMSGPVVLQAIQEPIEPGSDYIVSGPYAANSRDVFGYIKQNIDEDESIVFWKPRVLSYLTDRKSVNATSLEGLTRGHSKYVLVFFPELPTDRSNKALVEVTSENPEHFSLIYRNPDFSLYKILASQPQ